MLPHHTSLVSVVSAIGVATPIAALIATAAGSESAVVDAVEAGIRAGLLVRSGDGRVSAVPYTTPDGSSASAAEETRRWARAAVSEAVRQEPGDLSLQAAWVGLAALADPGVRESARGMMRRVRWSLRAAVLVDRLDAAQQIPRLLAALPRDTLALLIDGGRSATVLALVPPDDAVLRAMHALSEDRVDDAWGLLEGAEGLEAALLRCACLHHRYDAAGLRRELTRLEGCARSEVDALEVDRLWYVVARITNNTEEKRRIEDQLSARVAGSRDPGLKVRVLVEELIEAASCADVGRAKSLLSELGNHADVLDSPTLRAIVLRAENNVAAYSGDYAWSERTTRGLAELSVDRRQVAFAEISLMMVRGERLQALARPEVRELDVYCAQILAGLYRYEEALERLDTGDIRGYTADVVAYLRASIAVSIEDIDIIEPSADLIPRGQASRCLTNAQAALHRGDLDDAARWLDRGLQVVRALQIWGIGSGMLLAAADLGMRRGDRTAARDALDRFDGLHRHPHDFLTNTARLARALLDGAAPDAELLERMVQAEDRGNLALAARAGPLPPGGAALLASLDPRARARIDASWLLPRSRPVMRLLLSDRQVVLPSGQSLSLRRSGAPWRVLVALAHQHRDAPGEAINLDDLFSLGWPGERIGWEAARARMYTVARRLRKMGVEGLETTDDGYRLSPDWQVELCGAQQG